jgi:hypothetical protein
MSKSSANPRKYSKGKDSLDPNEPLIVYIQLRMEDKDLTKIEPNLRYLASRRPNCVAKVVGVRKEMDKSIVTLGVHMGGIRSALRGTSPRMQHGYDLLWDIWEQLVEYHPVFSAPPGKTDNIYASMIGFDTKFEEEQEESLLAN